MIRVDYDRSTLIQEKKQLKNESFRTYRHKEFNEHVVELKEISNPDKEESKQPHAIAVIPGYQLWKFFRSMIDGKMTLLEEPRYMLRRGNDWVKVNSMKTV